MMEIVHVGGVSGVGKTMMLRELKRESNLSENKIHINSASRTLSELSLKHYGEELQRINTRQLLRIQKDYIKLVTKLPGQIVLIDSHHVKVSNNQIVLLTPDIYKGEFSCHIIVEADPNIILQRRINDINIPRSTDKTIINLEISGEKEATYKIAVETGVNVYTVNNNTLKSAIRDMVTIIYKEFKIPLRCQYGD